LTASGIISGKVWNPCHADPSSGGVSFPKEESVLINSGASSRRAKNYKDSSTDLAARFMKGRGVYLNKGEPHVGKPLPDIDSEMKVRGKAIHACDFKLHDIPSGDVV